MYQIPASEAERKRAMERYERDYQERLRKSAEANKRKAEWVKDHTCPYCGQCPPMPPWVEHPV